MVDCPRCSRGSRMNARFQGEHISISWFFQVPEDGTIKDPFRIVAPAPKISVLSWMLEGAHHLIVEPRGPEWIPEIAWEAYQTRPDVRRVMSIGYLYDFPRFLGEAPKTGE